MCVSLFVINKRVMVIMNRLKRIVGKKRLIKALGMLVLMQTSLTAHAVPSLPAGMPNGGCWADPMNNLIIKLGASVFTSNQEGAEAIIGFNTQPVNYRGWCYSTSGQKWASVFTSELGLYMPGKFSGYYALSDDVDVRIGINVFGTGDERFPPFSDLELSFATAGPDGNGITPLSAAVVGNNGKVYFKLRRTLIGGAFYVPGGVELARLYRYVYKGSQPNIPIYRLITAQTIIPVPAECRINEGKAIDVNFGLIESSVLTTSAQSSPYKESRQLQYKCNSTLSQNIKINLVAEPASFGNAIKTTNPDIGVVMLYNNIPVNPYQSFQTRLDNGMGSDNVSFAVIGNGRKPATGAFTGSAVLIISPL